jgi:cell division transport system permease protein
MTLWLRLHAQALGEAVRRVAAQPYASAASIAVLGLALALPLVAAMLLRTASAATAGLDTDPHVNVYLALEATDDDVRRIDQALRASPDAASVRFIPRAKALEEMKATTHLAGLLASLERNPLPHAFTVRVRSAEAPRVQAMKDAWSKLPRVDQVAADFEWSERIGRWIRFAERIVAGLGLLLAVAVLFVVGHVIRLQVLNRHAEIEVSQLVGATAADVRRPFLYHGGIQGAAAGAAATAVAYGIALWIDNEVRALTPSYVSDTKILFLDGSAIATVLGVASGLGLLGAWLAVERELRTFAGRRGTPPPH